MCCEPVLREHPALAPSVRRHRAPGGPRPGPVLGRHGPVARPRDPRRLRQDARDVALLLTSELVTNAILHARTPVQLGVLRRRRPGAGLRGRPAGRAAALSPARHSRDRPGGRGLALVEDLADDLGHHDVHGRQDGVVPSLPRPPTGGRVVSQLTR